MTQISLQKKESFLTAYNAHADAIFRHCYFRVFNRERAKELMQDTFMRVWEQMTKGVEIKNVKAFLYRTATNLIIDESRKKRTESLEALQEKGFNPGTSNEEKIFQNLELENVKIVVEQLNIKYRDVIILRYLQDMSLKEIADMLDISENVISVRIHRGLKEIKKLVKL